MSASIALPSARAIASAIDHTLLTPDATAEQVERLCEEARRHGFASVCVNGVHVPMASMWMGGTGIPVGTVVGFPLGANDPRVKVEQAARALLNGARELDMVMQIGALRSGDHQLVRADIAGVVAEARVAGALVKVILETGLLSEDEIRTACWLAVDAGADFVKTSTGFGPRGASVRDVEIMRAAVGPSIGVKASGGIRTASQARELLAAGATRLGTSASVAILSEAS